MSVIGQNRERIAQSKWPRRCPNVERRAVSAHVYRQQCGSDAIRLFGRQWWNILPSIQRNRAVSSDQHGKPLSPERRSDGLADQLLQEAGGVLNQSQRRKPVGVAEDLER